jgi:hypothetical protein
MIGLLIGCVTNLIFDPVFIFVFHWGVKGAAWATILGQFLNAVFYLVYLGRFKSVSLTKEYFSLSSDILNRVSSLGISNFITQFALVLVMAVTNNVLVIYGAKSVYGSDNIAARGRKVWRRKSGKLQNRRPGKESLAAKIRNLAKSPPGEGKFGGENQESRKIAAWGRKAWRRKSGISQNRRPGKESLAAKIRNLAKSPPGEGKFGGENQESRKIAARGRKVWRRKSGISQNRRSAQGGPGSANQESCKIAAWGRKIWQRKSGILQNRRPGKESLAAKIRNLAKSPPGEGKLGGENQESRKIAAWRKGAGRRKRSIYVHY